MPVAPINGITICFDEVGDPDGVPLLLVAGLGGQLITWDDAFCEALADRGFRVVRFDNRDVGQSSSIETEVDPITSIFSIFTGGTVEAPYTLADMALDAVGVLDHLGIDRAHVVGRSMGGMIAQQIAIAHPARVLSLTSIMSTTGEPDVGQPDPAILPSLLSVAPAERDAAIDHAVAQAKLISSPEHFDEDIVRDLAARAWERGRDGMGVARQLLAVLASGSRAEGLAQLDVPTLVFHGDIDPLVGPSGGARTAELVPGAELVVLEGMAHDMPPAYWARMIAGITALAARVADSTPSA